MRDNPEGGELNPADTAPMSRRLVVVQSPLLFSSSGPKWRGNFPEGSDHPVASHRLELSFALSSSFQLNCFEFCL